MRKPPQILELILKGFLRYDDQEAFLGDFEERYTDTVNERGIFAGILWYLVQAIISVPRIIKNNYKRGTAMLKNYLKITSRNILKYRSFSFINISGLALGISCCLLILIYVMDELSYDRYHEKAENIYRIVTEGLISGTPLNAATTPVPAGPAITADFPEVLDYVRFFQDGCSVKYGEKIFDESDFCYADNSVFDIFSFELILGDRETALKVPYTLVITEEMAEKYFGDKDPIGESLRIDNNDDYTVTGIIRKPPVNSHFSFDILASFDTLYDLGTAKADFWGQISYYTYILIEDDADYLELNNKLIDASKRNYAKLMEMVPGAEVKNYLQPLTSIHLHSNLMGEAGTNSSIGFVYAFSTIAFFILVIACINFMNLTTARSANRAKEIGLRKVMGAYRSQLTKQFLGESVIFSLLSIPIALLIVNLAHPLFNNLTGKELEFAFTEMPGVIIALAVIIFFVGVISGSYPAVYLSGFKPVKTIKGELQQGAKHSVFRNILVVSQLTISVFLIIGSFIILDQLNYLKNKDLGFDREKLLVMRFREGTDRSRVESLKTEIRNLSSVSNVSVSSAIPASGFVMIDGFFPEGVSDNQSILMQRVFVDEDYVDTFGVEIIHGRGFNTEMGSDFDNTLLINEFAVKDFGWDEPVGKKIGEFASRELDRRNREVIGVVKDFHVLSLYDAMQPMTIALDWFDMRYITAKISTDDTQGLLRSITTIWEDMLPDQEFRNYFLDEFYNRSYTSEEKLSRIFRVFTGLSVIIGCLGLFGLASFTAEQRTKEIGIRKTLGSSLSAIINLLVRDYLMLVIFANIIAWPAGYFLMKTWLNSFPYQTSINAGVFITALLITASIAILTVSYQTLKVAFSNPVNALRYE